MLRNLVSNIDVDQLVEDAGALNALTALMDEQVPPPPPKKTKPFNRIPRADAVADESMGREDQVRAGAGGGIVYCICCVGRVMLLLQKLETPGLEEVLARKKKADDENR